MLELAAGAGAVGLLVAGLGARSVCLTDLAPASLALLSANVALNGLGALRRT